MYYLSSVRVSRTKYFQILCLNVLNHVTSAPGVCAGILRRAVSGGRCSRDLVEVRQTVTRVFPSGAVRGVSQGRSSVN